MVGQLRRDARYLDERAAGVGGRCLRRGGTAQPPGEAVRRRILQQPAAGLAGGGVRFDNRGGLRGQAAVAEGSQLIRRGGTGGRLDDDANLLLMGDDPKGAILSEKWVPGSPERYGCFFPGPGCVVNSGTWPRSASRSRQTVPSGLAAAR